VKEKRKNA